MSRSLKWLISMAWSLPAFAAIPVAGELRCSGKTEEETAIGPRFESAVGIRVEPLVELLRLPAECGG